MCGRFTLTQNLDVLIELFGLDSAPADLAPRYNIAPTQEVAALPNLPVRRLERFRWGLVPHWAKDTSAGARWINARAETAAEKPAFREALRRRRCLIPADGFYEWRKEGRGKTPYHVRRADGGPFAFAGLWEVWTPAGGEPLRTCTILTTAPNPLLAPSHDRMPVVLPREAFATWLDPGERAPQDLLPLLAPWPAEGWVAHPVSPLVNSPANEGPHLTVPLSAPPALF